jgi:monothiol glutaredoxin
MRKYDLLFEDRDIINDSEQRQEMFRKTGQMMQPCVEVDGKMLVDVSGEEVEAYLLSNDFVTAGSGEADAPTNKACAQHEADEVSIDFGQPRM